MLRYETPSWFYGDKRVDYGICEVSVCPRTNPKGMLRRPFHYDDSSMYATVGSISYIAESVVPGRSRCIDGKSVGLKISDLTIAKYVDDINWLPNDVSACYKASPRLRHALLSLYEHEISFMQHYHALDIRVLTVTESAVVEVPS